MTKSNKAILFILLGILLSCNNPNGNNDDTVLARVHNIYLYGSNIDGIVPNEFDTIGALFDCLCQLVLNFKDTCMLSARRIWIEAPQYIGLT